MIKLIIPITLGIGLLLYIFKTYSKREVGRKEFIFTLLISMVLTLSPIIYSLTVFIGNILGFTYSYVLLFLLSILFIITIQIHITRRIMLIDERTVDIVREVSFINSELKERGNK